MQQATATARHQGRSARQNSLFWALLAALFCLTPAAFAQVRLPEPGVPFVELKPLPLPEWQTVPGVPGLDQLRVSLDAGRLADAVGQAEIMRAAAAREGQAAELGALQNLARVKLIEGEPLQARDYYSEALELLEADSRDRRDPRRIAILQGLGVSAFQLRRYVEAQAFFEQAQFVARSSLGLWNAEQLAPLAALSETQLALGAYEAATDRASAQLAIIRRQHGESSEQAFEQSFRSAAVYGRVGQYNGQRRLLRETLKAIRKKHGNDDWRQVELLRAVARTYRAEYLPEIYGLTDLELAQDIIEEHPDRFTAVDQAAVLRDLGDYYMTFLTPKKAHRLYAKSYALLEQAGAEAKLKQWYGQPEILFVPQPAPLEDVGTHPAAGLPVGYVAFKFGITLQGQVQRPETIEIVPAAASSMRLRADRAIREARFRPRITAQGPLPEADFEYRLRFRYVPESDSSAASTTVGAAG